MLEYEIATFQALRDQLRCKEIWVLGADRWRNPDEDLPQDFEQHRGEHYKALQQPLNPAEFIDEVRRELQAELAALRDALPELEFLEIADRGKQGAIKPTPLKAQPDSPNLNALKRDVRSRWGMVALINMLKESILRTGCLEIVSDLARGARRSPETLTQRLMLAIYGYGTNLGIRGVAQKTIFLCRYLRDRELQREVQEGLNIVEGWHRGVGLIFFGGGGGYPVQPPRRAGALGAVPARPAGGDGAHQHADASERPPPGPLLG